MAIKNVLIQPQEVTGGGIFKTSPTTARFDPIKITPQIKVSELKWLAPILCDDFYNDLIEQKQGIVSNYNVDIDPNCPLQEAYPDNECYEKLWCERLLPYLSYAVVYESLPTIGFQIASCGVFSMDTNYQKGAGIEEIKFIEQKMLETLECLKADLIKHLCNNKIKYPLFCSECHCKCDCGCCDSCNNNEEPNNTNFFISY